MTNQPTENEKSAILSQILESPEFQNSKRHRDLLAFLVARSFSEDPIKEIEIAMEVLGKDATFDPTTDPTVRSYVSNLRKKLEHHYLTTEDHHAFRIEIPKGHYQIAYVATVASKRPSRARAALSRFSPAIILALLITVSVLVFVLLTRPPEYQGSGEKIAGPLWDEFLKSDGRPILVVLGDFFFMRERGNSDVYIRKGKINDLDEYLEYIRTNPEFGHQYARNSFTFLRPSAPFGLMLLTPILQQAPNGFSMKLASDFSTEDFRTNNVVFIGSFKTLHILRNFLNIFNLRYSTVAPSSFHIEDGIGDSSHVFVPERLAAGSLEKDFGVVAKGQGPEGSIIMMLMGFSESGAIQATRAASDPSLLRTIAGRFPPNASIDATSCTFVIAAEGMTQSLFRTDIVYVAGVGSPMPLAVPGSADSLVVR